MRLAHVAGSIERTLRGELELGTVYGTLLNFRGALTALGEAVHAPPYGAPPRAPVLYIKPANTHASHGATVCMPAGVESLRIGAALGIVFARRATRVSPSDALDYVLGYTIASDVSVPHDSYYRPAVRSTCRDGFCPLGPAIVSRNAVSDPNHLPIAVRINGQTEQTDKTSQTVRSVEQLIADVTEFMTLDAGDVLLLGVPADAPHAHAGDHVEIEIGEIGILSHSVALAEGRAQEAP
ncbi:fumarylacetoacetate hydrolase family protein [Trinickia fusca]|uniref:2-hydroxyhepta-2,4-diene-1,7-dioate isomerase n=1 Tax=Trinickia fusca TaxID=2419777 RepID=A0A494XPE4_9BURK|nr:fumarylacetoacetate hydrolase family protein [Trinickia fusca]RKP52527.1 2-hydroxyhepta-2,4-diene-1,7-dioate isomerase [Trinickia fusca]